jgi:hypothetical protein
LNNTFYSTDETPFSKEMNDEIIKEDEQVMIGQPSNLLLPQETRKLLSSMLKANGIMQPKIALMIRSKGTQDIVFNLTPVNCESEEKYRTLMETISWFLPKHYSFLGMEERTLGNGFAPL